MARGHASNIVVREAPVPEIPPDEPKVVIALETDPRKVPTHRRLLEGREAALSGGDGARAAMLPVHAGGPSQEPVPRAAAAAGGREARPAQSQQTTQPSARLPTLPRRGTSEGEDPAAPGAGTHALPGAAGARAQREASAPWLRTALVVVFFGLAGGAALRLRARSEHVEVRPLHAAHLSLPALEPQAITPLPLTAEPTPAEPPIARSEAASPATTTPAPTAAPPPSPPQAPAPNAEPARHVARAAAAKPAFTPPFQLPFEKN